MRRDTTINITPNYELSEKEFFSKYRSQKHIDEYFDRQRERQEFEAGKKLYRSRQFEEALNKGEVDNTNDWYYKNGQWEVVK